MSAATAKATLAGLVLLFLFPLVMSWLMYTGVIDYAPRDTQNRGTLIQPPVKATLPPEFQDEDLGQHWVVLYPLPATCGALCQEEIAGVQQVRKALGRDGARLRHVLLAQPGAGENALPQIDAIDPEASVLADNTGMLRDQLKETKGDSGTYIIDPLGNVMMHYAAGTEPDDILADLERLLQYAKTDQQQ